MTVIADFTALSNAIVINGYDTNGRQGTGLSSCTCL